MSILKRILDDVNSRKKLYFTLADALMMKLKTIRCCRKTSADQRYKEFLYIEGRKKIVKELDIRHIVKELRALKFISNVLLTKHQRAMLLHFKGNLLNYTFAKIKPFDKKDMIPYYIQRTLSMSRTSKIDKRLIKNVNIAYEESENVKMPVSAR